MGSNPISPTIFVPSAFLIAPLFPIASEIRHCVGWVNERINARRTGNPFFATVP